jgi:hypothetical protein
MTGMRNYLIALALVMVVGLIPSCDREHTLAPEVLIYGPGGIQVGMSREEVIQVMLRNVQVLQMMGGVRNPHAVEFVKDSRGKMLEVMYYYDGMKKADNLVTVDELVPIVLSEDIVVGWGWDYLEEFTAKKGPTNPAATDQ